jgi:hypothetical protein
MMLMARIFVLSLVFGSAIAATSEDRERWSKVIAAAGIQPE